MSNAKVMSQLTEAMTRGAATGAVGGMDAHSAVVQELDAAIADCKDRGCESEESAKLLAVAVSVRRLRGYVQAADWRAAGDTVESMEGAYNASVAAGIAPASIRAELNRARVEVQERRAVQGLSAALSSGGPTGNVGGFHCNTVELEMLDAAIRAAAQMGCRTETSRGLLRTAEAVRSVRLGLLETRWDDLDQLTTRLLAMAAPPAPKGAEGGGEVLGYFLVGDGLEEIQFVRAELNDRDVGRVLRAALASGSAKGPVGGKAFGAIVVDGLERGLQRAGEVELGCEETQRLVASCQLVLQLRKTLASYDIFTSSSRISWDEVENIVDEAITADDEAQDGRSFKTVAPEARVELQEAEEVKV